MKEKIEIDNPKGIHSSLGLASPWWNGDLRQDSDRENHHP